MKKLATIVLALVVSVVTNVIGADNAPPAAGTYKEPTGGIAIIRKADDAKKESGPLRFKLTNGTTPGEWGCMIGGELTEDPADDKFVFMEGPFKGQTYKVVKNAQGKFELHEQGGRKTVWTQQ